MNRLLLKINYLWNPYYVSILIVSILIGEFVFSTFYRGAEIRGGTICWLSGMFLIGYCLIKPFSTLPFWKFFVYLVATLAYENWVVWFLKRELIFHMDVTTINPFPFGTLFPLILRMAWTILWLKFFFKIETKPAILLGILIGILSFSTFPLR